MASNAQATSLKISVALPLMFLLIAALGTIGAGLFGRHHAERQAVESGTARLTGSTITTERGAQDWVAALTADVDLIATDPTVRRAMDQFALVWAALPNGGADALRNAYVDKNPYPAGDKARLDSSSAAAPYDIVHEQYHPYLRRLAAARGLTDLMLFDRNGTMIYSVAKGPDLAADFRGGAMASTAVGQFLSRFDPDAPASSAQFIDFSAYAPDGGTNAAFLVRAINDPTGRLSGILAARISTGSLQERMNRIATVDPGTTVYVIGTNGASLVQIGGGLRDPVGVPAAFAPAIAAANDGQTGIDFVNTISNGPGYVSYRQVRGVGWAWSIMAAASEATVVANANGTQRDALTQLPLLLAALGILGLIFARSITAPLIRLRHQVTGLSASADPRLDISRSRWSELGEIAQGVEALRTAKSAEPQLAPVPPPDGVFQKTSAAMLLADASGVVLSVNEPMRRLLRSNAPDFASSWPEFDPTSPTGSRIPEVLRRHSGTTFGLTTMRDTEIDLALGGLRLSARVTALPQGGRTESSMLVEFRDTTKAMTRDVVIEAICETRCVAEFSPDGRISSANPAYAAMFNGSLGSMSGRPFSDGFTPSDRQDGVPNGIWDRLNAGETVDFIGKRTCAASATAQLHTLLVPILGRDGALDKVVEISAAVLPGESPQRSEDRTMTSINDFLPIVELRPDGSIQTANAAFLSLTGYAAQDLIDRPYTTLLVLDDMPQAQLQMFRSALEAGSACSGAWILAKEAGASLTVAAVFCPVRNDTGYIQKILICMTSLGDAIVRNGKQPATRQRDDTSQKIVVDALSTGLKALAAGNMTTSLNTPFDQEYDQLRIDFNDAVDQLRTAMQEVVLKSQCIRGGAAQISQSTDDLAKRTEGQAGSLEQTASAIEQLTSSVRSSADRAQVAEQATTKAQSDAASGEQVVRHTIAAMNEIDQSSERISEIIGVIEDIAFQTNLLALNAGVEAARAGDAGRGFAVVASEVRALAQRCSDAAKEIKELISESGDQVKRGVDLVGRTGAALEEINGSVVEIASLVQDIATSSKEQSIGLSEINAAVSRLDEVTQQNSAMVEETTAASHDLTTDADELASLIDRFLIDARADQEASLWREAESGTPQKSLNRRPARSQRRVLAPPPNRLSSVAAPAEPVDDGWEDS